LITGLAGAALALIGGPAAAQESACDPAAEICLLTPGPWLSPQYLRYSAPASMPGTPRVRWSQGKRSGNAAQATILSERDGVRSWSLKLPSGIRGGPLSLRARIGGPTLERIDAARVQARVGSLRARIRKRTGSFIASLNLTTVRRPVQARLQLRLLGRRRSTQRVLGRWRIRRRVAAGANRELVLRADLERAQRLCVLHRGCRVELSARVRALGFGLGRAADRRRVAPLWRPDLGAAKRFARGRGGPVSFSIIEPNGRQSGYRSSATAPAASLTKPILMTAFLRRPGVRGRSLNAYERDLLGRMIRVSDDPAAITVRQLAGEEAITDLVRAAGMRDSSFYGSRGFVGGLSRISARDQAGFFHSIKGLLPSRHRSFAGGLLAAIAPSQRWGVAAARPRDWELMFKGGWGIGDDSGPGTVNHQSALLERGRCRIALSILTEHNGSHEHGTATLRGVAERLLDGARRLRCRPPGR
jgi:hypothetical protein